MHNSVSVPMLSRTLPGTARAGGCLALSRPGSIR